jgi:tetratricopeptide (TPR) repeat protein
VQAVALRYLKQPRSALETLDRLQQIEPRYARAWQEAGHNLRVLGDLSGATSAYARAVELSGLYRKQNKPAAAQSAQAEFERLSRMPKELVSVSSLINEGKLFQAENLCRSFLKKTPHHVEAMRLLALLGMKLFIYDDAEFLLESCVEFEPKNWLARHDYVGVLHKRQKFDKALEQAEILHKAFPDNHVFELAFANENVAVGNFELALKSYDRVIERQPDFEYPYLSRGHALKTVGRLEEAIDSYHSAYRARPGFGDAYWSLANLKTYRFTNDEIANMQRHAQDPATQQVDRFHLCFALGAAFEAREDYATAFGYYEQGNRLKKADVRYEPKTLEAAMQRQKEFCTSGMLERQAGQGSPEADPIFIVGLPRAGSTLLENPAGTDTGFTFAD